MVVKYRVDLIVCPLMPLIPGDRGIIIPGCWRIAGLPHPLLIQEGWSRPMTRIIVKLTTGNITFSPGCIGTINPVQEHICGSFNIVVVRVLLKIAHQTTSIWSPSRSSSPSSLTSFLWELLNYPHHPLTSAIKDSSATCFIYKLT